MTNLTNLQRDMAWITPDSAPLQFSADNGGDLVHIDGNLYDKDAYATCVNTPVSGTLQRSFGVAVVAPLDETIPYRVKADLSVSGDHAGLSIGFAYADGALSPGDQDVTGLRLFGFPASSLYDDVWAMRPSILNVGKPLVFLINISGAENVRASGKISVQRLLGKPDNYASGVA